MKFALTGAAGYIAPRHLAAIHDTGNELVAACDPHDSVGMLDRYFSDTSFFTEFERFDRYLEKLRRASDGHGIDYLSVCSPNHLHDAHIRTALRLGAHALCEKPLVLNPWNLDALEELEAETGRHVYTVLQLRTHPSVCALRESIVQEEPREKHAVDLDYITARGPWYRYSWKGDIQKSGGIATNIGIHFFDMLLWLFGDVEEIRVTEASETRMRGVLELARARVRWRLSLERTDIPDEFNAVGATTYRMIALNGQQIDFTDGFADLHTSVYEKTLAGSGFRIADARPSIQLVYDIRHAVVSSK